jgi:hypothetical protein
MNKSKEVIEPDNMILLIDFKEALEVRGIEVQAKFIQAQELAEKANAEREKLTEEKIPEQYQDYIKVFAKESFNGLPE